MNGSLVPANTKQATLIGGILRPFPDLVIAIVGVVLTIAGLIIIGSEASMLLLIASLLPMLISLLLVLPLPNYHNTLCAIQSVLNFYTNRKNFIWKGWCMRDEFKEETK